MLSIREKITSQWLQSRETSKKLCGQLALSARSFRIQNIYDFTRKIFMEGQEGIEIDGYCLKLPYDPVIFEFELKFPDRVKPLEYGVICMMLDADTMNANVCVNSTHNDMLVVSMFRFKLNPDGTPINSAMKESDLAAIKAKVGEDFLKDQGTVKDYIGEEAAFSHKIPKGERMDKKLYQNCLTVGIDALIPVMYGLNLLNCKNVRQTVHSTHDGLTRKQRQKVACDEYRMLNVPLINRIASGEIKISDIGGKQPLHTVRGHTKTYTADAPLLGKHIGRWFWGPMVRGSTANGVIQKEYSTSGELS